MGTENNSPGWVLVGTRPKEGKTLEDSDVEKMLSEAFMPERKFTLFLCGAYVNDKTGTLEEMEEGYSIIKTEMKEYQHGDYGIVSSHEEGELLFMPIELTEEDLQNVKNLEDNDAKTISRNTDTVPEEGSASA